MVSKYRAHLGLSQEQMDSLSEKFPEINDAVKFPNVTTVIQYLLDMIVNGDLVEKRFQSIHEDKELDRKLKSLRIVDLQVKIQRQLIHDLKVSPSQTLQVVKRELELDETDSELAKVKPNFEVQTPDDETETDGFNELGLCSTCKHLHYLDPPRTCKNGSCNCGVRG